MAAEYVKELMAKLPPMRPLLFILKIFLQQREMNEVRCLPPAPSHRLITIALHLLDAMSAPQPLCTV